ALAGVNEWTRSSWLMLPLSWPGLAMICLLYCYGFRAWIVIPLLAYFADMSLQGFHRFRVIIPAWLICQIYLDRYGMRWPSMPMVGLLAALALLFFPLKIIGRTIQEGGALRDIIDASGDVWTNLLYGGSGDAM